MKVFDDWRGQPLDEALSACRELVEDPEYPTVNAGARRAARWRVISRSISGS